RTLVTGVTGFAGGHLAEALLAAGDGVVGVARRAAWPPEWAHLAGRVPLLACDLSADDRLEGLLRETAPDRTAHLAGYAHAGRPEGPGFAVAHFARQLVAVERGERPPLLETGDLRPQRDLTDVRDVAAAYVLLLEKGRAGAAYNVGTGRSVSMQAVLDRLIA